MSERNWEFDTESKDYQKLNIYFLISLLILYIYYIFNFIKIFPIEFATFHIKIFSLLFSSFKIPMALMPHTFISNLNSFDFKTFHLINKPFFIYIFWRGCFEYSWSAISRPNYNDLVHPLINSAAHLFDGSELLSQ